MQKKDFDAQNLGFSCRKKILMHRISGFGVEKKIFMHKMPQFEEEMKTERTILSEKRAHRDFDTPFIAHFMFLWVQKSLI